MTRLTDDDVRDLSNELDDIDTMLVENTGMSMRQLACEAAGFDPTGYDLSRLTAVSVPITSGLGVISRFSESVSDTAKGLGIRSFVTEGADVTGFAEAVSAGADIVLMADDFQFIAYSTKAAKYSNNSFCTAAGYITALKGAARGLKGRQVLVLGAGRVGSEAVRLLIGMDAEVVIADVDVEKAGALASRYKGAVFDPDIDHAISSNSLILNASPAFIPGHLIKQGSVISTPGIPYLFDEEGRRKARIIHDPLAIGTSVMIMQAVSFTLRSGDQEVRI
jgi:3-methylornithyl-N6-L-lysine dehydrogenase